MTTRTAVRLQGTANADTRRHAVGNETAAQQVLAGLTMSLDGYITGPGDGPGAGLGEGGERLHY